MTDAEKKISDAADEQDSASPAHEDADTDGSDDMMSQAAQRITELEAQVAEANDKMLRALAEAENTKRRVLKEKEDAVKFASANFARNLLSVADNFRRALDAVQDDQLKDDNIQNLVNGIKAIEREMLQAFDMAGIRKIEPVGEAFDPNVHEVMFEVETTDATEGTIIQVIEPGYIMNERLLRPARVGVAKNSGESPASVDTMA